MSLPVPADRPIAPFIQYGSTNPPFIPPVPVPPLVQRVVPMVCSAVANEAAAKAMSNTLRMLCFNLLANANWNSKEFGDVVYLVCGRIALYMQKGFYTDPELGISDSVQTVLTLYASSLLFAYPEMRSIVEPRVADASAQNVPQLDNLKKEIAAMHQQPPGHGMPGPGYPNSGYPVGGYAHTPMGYPVHNGGYQMHPTPGHYMPHGGFPGHHFPQGQQHPGGFHQGGSGFQHHRPTPTHPAAGHGFAGGSAFGTQVTNDHGGVDRFATRSRARPQQQQQPETNYTAAPAPKEKTEQPVETNDLQIDKGSEMDRAQHQITYFGNAYHQDLDKRMSRLNEASESLVAAQVTDTEQKHVFGDWLMCASLEDAITSGRVEQFKRQASGAGADVFRVFAAIAKPIVSTVDIGSTMTELRKANTFNELANKIRAAAAAMDKVKGEDTTQADSMISFLNQVDTRLTTLINNFLSINLGLKGLSIGSFAEDISSLGGYLQKKFGVDKAIALTTYESEIFAILDADVDEKTLADVSAGLTIPSDMFVTALPESYSITYLFLSSRELGYKVGAEPSRINHRTAPALHRVIESLARHKEVMKVPTLHDVIVTADNVVYRVYRDYTRGNEFMISMA